MCNQKDRRDYEPSDEDLVDNLPPPVWLRPKPETRRMRVRRLRALIKGGQGRSAENISVEAVIVFGLLILLGIPMLIWMYFTY